MTSSESFDQRLADHELPEDAHGNELRVFGPPGTGKTTYLTARISNAARRFGARSVLVMSHTGAAARELISKDLAVPTENVATLHSICYRAMQKPRIAETVTSHWNEREPGFKLSPRYDDQGQPTGKETLGDQVLRSINALRARMIPVERWPSYVIPFWRAWCAWKSAESILDFTDLIEQCLRNVAIAPGNPSVIICDEYQDFTPLQLALVRSWGKACAYTLLAGDDDQSLYGYAGADPQSMLQPRLADSQIRILTQSFRIPQAVHRYAIRQWSDRIQVRQPKQFHSKTEPGQVKRERTGGYDTRGLVDRLETQIAHCGDGENIMLLGSAHFALVRTMDELRRRGVPFGNRYRPDNLTWNPLGGKGNGAGRRIETICAARPRRGSHWWWTGAELKLWTEWLRADGTFLHGTKEEIARVDSDSSLDPGWLARRMPNEEWDTLQRHINHSDAAAADWWQRRVLPKHRRDATYAAQVVDRAGLASVTANPKLIVGTIHSVKGAQAKTVYVLPDLTNRWIGDLRRGGATRDGILRMYYVACTRAKELLVLCEPMRRGSSIELGMPA